MENDLKQTIVNANWYKFKKLIERFNLTNIKDSNIQNVKEFNCGNDKYYISLYKFKIRKEGSKEWSGKIITILNKSYKENCDIWSMID